MAVGIAIIKVADKDKLSVLDAHQFHVLPCNLRHHHVGQLVLILWQKTQGNMASILKRMPHLKFIMTDCCNMMCLENLYELRSVCDYMIGSPAEIPDQGAPYDQIVTDMFAEGKFYSNIITKYYNATRGYLPLTAVKTSEMDNVARATRTALRTFAPADVYQQWNQVLNRAVVDLRESAKWATDKPWSMKYADFSASEEKMHGVSMFVPQDPSRGNYARFNEDIKKMEWYAATN